MAQPDTLAPQDFLARRRDTDAVIDVRTPAEVAEGMLAGARHLDFMAPDFAEKAAALDRDQTYYLYCRSGNRSGQAAQRMRGMGFENVYNVGGYDALVRAGAPTDR